MKKVIFKIAFVILIPLLLIGTINYIVDPDYILNESYIPRLSDALKSGKMIAGPVNVNSRKIKKEWILSTDEVPEMLVLGSSRTLNLSKYCFPERAFFNASVTNCTLNDMLAFLWLFKEKGKWPSEIIVCADQWLLNDQSSEKRSVSLKSEYMLMAKEIGVHNEFNPLSKWDLSKEKIKELFSTRYLLRSLRFRGKTNPFEITDDILPDKMMLMPDGSRRIPDYITNADQHTINEKAINYYYSSKDEHFSDLSVVKMNEISLFISFLEKQHCHITIFIPPFHPEVYKLLSNNERCFGITKADEFYRKLAIENNCLLIGSSDPNDISLKENDFYDGVHLKRESLELLFKTSKQPVSLHP